MVREPGESPADQSGSYEPRREASRWPAGPERDGLSQWPVGPSPGLTDRPTDRRIDRPIERPTDQPIRPGAPRELTHWVSPVILLW